MRSVYLLCLLAILICTIALTQSGTSTTHPIFAAPVAYDSGGRHALSVAVGDVNGDGKPDLLVVNECTILAPCSGSTVGVLLGNGDGTFQAVVTYGSGGQIANSVAVADVNGDGKLDCLLAINAPPAATARTAQWAYSWEMVTEPSRRR